MKTTAILIPTFKRFQDLVNTLNKTKIDERAKFIIVANLTDEELDFIYAQFGQYSIIEDERKYGKLGGAKAYNLAFNIAKKHNFDYAILYADDIVPSRADWLDRLYTEFIDKNGGFGIFSSDESHPGHFGWNIILDCPIAHFFIIDCALADQLFSNDYKQYAVDFEIAVRLKSSGVDIQLLPIKLNHLRSGLHRELMDQHMHEDINTLIRQYPEYGTSFRENKNLHYLKHSSETRFLSQIVVSKLPLWTNLKPLLPFRTRFKRRINGAIKRIFKLTGYKITKISQPNEEHESIMNFINKNGWLKHIQINAVLDIGANTGQFAKKISALYPTSIIHCFEPLDEPYQKLTENFLQQKQFKFHHFALGERDDYLTINLNEYSPSSSFLNMEDAHKSNFQYAVETSFQKVKVRKLDELSLNLIPPYLIKIDVQGFEDKVISGGRATIEKAAILIVEVSFKSMYEGQPLFDDIYRRLYSLNFRLHGNLEQLTSPLSGEILQADAIFIHKSLIN